MKVLFTADLHINLRKKNVPYLWQYRRYQALFSEILRISKKVDLIVIGGDIFDNYPDLNELALFMQLVHGINKETIIYDGNHEATTKYKTFLTDITEVIYYINNKVKVISGIYHKHGIDFIGYTHIKKFGIEDKKNRILATHVRGAIPPHVKPEIDLTRLDIWDVVLAGDLHNYSNSQRNILYPGSPLSTNFHRERVKNGIIILDTETLKYEWEEIELPQLIRKTIANKSEVRKTDYDHTIYNIKGSLSDLSDITNIKDSGLVDKKIVNTNHSSSLDFKELDLKGEVCLYLKDILKYKQEDIDRIGEVYDSIR